MKQIYLLSFLFIFCSNSVIAQPSFPPPSGVYCSCGPTTGNGFGSVNPKIAAKDFVQGILVRVSWDQCEASEDVYDWSLIEGQISAANQYGKKISLAIGSGQFVPDWVFDAGAKSMKVLIPNTQDTIPVPWDSVYMSHWTDFISELGAYFENDTTIQLVYITNSSSNGYEMQLPFSSSPTLSDLGYTDQKIINSWKEVVQSFGLAFPNHYLSNDFHPVNGSNVVADSVYAYALSVIGNRYGANAWWWTQKNTGVYPSQYQIILNSSSNNLFTGVQFANNGTKDSAAFGEGGMPAALAKAIGDKICYWEIWNEDILNPAFEDLLSNASCLKTGIKSFSDDAHLVYPNPSNGVFHIQLPQQNEDLIQLELYTIDGKKVLTKMMISKEQINLDLSHLNRGLYLIQIKKEGSVLLRQKLILD